jgi:hypothetical protein
MPRLVSDSLDRAYFAADPLSLRKIRALITEEWESAKRVWIAAMDGHWYFCGEICPVHGRQLMPHVRRHIYSRLTSRHPWL